MPVFLDDLAARAGLAAAALYIALLILMLVALTYLVILQRVTKKVGIGDGGDPALSRAIRVHGNFAENAGFAVAGLIALALISAPVWLIHLCGMAMLAGRLAHAFALSQSVRGGPVRVAGMALTHVSFVTCALALLRFALS